MRIHSEAMSIFSIKVLNLIFSEMESVGLNVNRSKQYILFNNRYTKLSVEIIESSKTLGHFDPNRFSIGINKQFSYQFAHEDLIEVIRHEIIHLVNYLENGDNVKSHGTEFKAIAKRYNWQSEAKSKMKLKTDESSNPELKVFKKVKKLLAMADSSNINESQVALKKANDLICKYHLESVEKVSNEQVYSDVVISSSRRNSKTSAIYFILKSFPFIAPIFSSGLKYNELLVVVKDREEMEMAKYITSFLDHELDRLWLKTKKEQKLKGISAKNSFFRGLADGFTKKMSPETINNSTDLVLSQKQIDKIQQDLIDSAFSKIKSSVSKSGNNTHSRNLGEQAGRSMSINPALKSNDQDTKLIS
jgi:hypothetical protein